MEFVRYPYSFNKDQAVPAGHEVRPALPGGVQHGAQRPQYFNLFIFVVLYLLSLIITIIIKPIIIVIPNYMRGNKY